jgi:transcriptional regulator GlxA family with amidase domain
MLIATLIFDELTPLDAVGPIEMLSRVPDAEVVIVAPTAQAVRDSRTHWMFLPERTFEQVGQPDVLLIPGGPGVDAVVRNEPLMRWIRVAHETTSWTTSVCTGALVLAAAGVLAGRRATTHARSLAELARYDVDVVSERVVRDGKIITSAGVSAGIDLALVLAAQLAGEAVALGIARAIEYDQR